MKSIINKLKITNGTDFSLKQHDSCYTGDLKKKEGKAMLKKMIVQTAGLQDELYADDRFALLIIFQAMDAGGKDSAIAHTLSGINPQGCEVYSFKQPNAEELSHDFLWRHIKALPQFGRIGVHNRSHYENVLVTKVHPDLLLKEKLPTIKTAKDAGKKFWDERYASIRNFERHIAENGTVMIKFFLHISKAEQKKRFLKRINDPAKNWKFQPNDVYEREFFDGYMKAYEKAIKETANAECPWYVIPADKKWFARIAISGVILETLEGMKLKYPVLPKADMDKLEDAKKELEK